MLCVNTGYFQMLGMEFLKLEEQGMKKRVEPGDRTKLVLVKMKSQKQERVNSRKRTVLLGVRKITGVGLSTLPLDRNLSCRRQQWYGIAVLTS